MQDEVGSQPDAATLHKALAEIDQLKVEVAALRAEQAAANGSSWKAWFAAASTATVTLLAFLIPSVQEQWDRLQQRGAIETYRDTAHELMKQSRFHAAEEAFARALELSTGPRLDIERERLVAKTAQVNSDPAWSGRIDDSVEENDFLLLETMQAQAHDPLAQSWTLNNHAVFLANHGDAQRARALAERAAQQAPKDARPRVTLGNVLWDLGDLQAAQRAYSEALALNPDDVNAHYNLALLYEALGKVDAAVAELRRVVGLRADDAAREDLQRIEACAAEHT
jgi:tetratricopeptide (TPR) repeat protein